MIDDYVKYVVRNKRVNRFVTALVRQGLRKNKAIIVLVERQRHVRRLAKLLDEFHPCLIYGPVKQEEREKIIRRFEKGKEHLIVASVVFTKGVNIKRVNMIIDAAQRRSKNDAMQKLGRGVRLHKTKNGLLYFDLYTASNLNTIKCATSRRTAFKRAKIPVVSINMRTKQVVNFNYEARCLIERGEKTLNVQQRAYSSKRTSSKGTDS